MENIIIKDWFLEKNFSEHERYAISVSDIEILKETEKAYLLKFISEFGKVEKWIPKACIKTNEEIKAEREQAENNLNKYEKLVEWAKQNGLKVRNRMKKTTIITIIKNAGLEVPSELI